jgi:hypothetical protein
MWYYYDRLFRDSNYLGTVPEVDAMAREQNYTYVFCTFYLFYIVEAFLYLSFILF